LGLARAIEGDPHLKKKNVEFFFFLVVLEFELQGFTLARQVLYCLRYTSSPEKNLFNKWSSLF
jgi:hypothetical protein